MGDIATFWSAERIGGDWRLGPDLASGHDLETAVLISLFTDQTAAPEDTIPDGSDDPRGWWGDQGADRPIGSKLWLRARAKQTQGTLNTVHDDIVEALQWLIDDGVVGRIDVLTEWSRTRFLAAQVTLHRPGRGPTVFRYEVLWAQLDAPPRQLPPDTTTVPTVADPGSLFIPVFGAGHDPAQVAVDSVVG